ncbi:MAG TPA: FAD-dependent oxidoreductase [Gemmatimonadaceae bacterium]|nr:FAD-dependent oxidoreductase [Gemmatimonadaceae bacterium]
MSAAPRGGAAADGRDVAIVGGGLVALASAAALSARGAAVTLVAHRQPGEASPAAAGMLAPGVERAEGPAHDFAIAARDLYPGYVDAIAELTGIRVPLNRDGILELVGDEREADARRRDLPPHARWLSARELRELEPGAAPMAGALFHPRDGAVDNVVLVRALRKLVEASSSVTIVEEPAAAVDAGESRPAVHLASGGRISADTLVLAAGAWTPLLGGLPRAIPVEPVRGQMIAVAATPLRHVAYGAGHGYLVPRAQGVSVVGSTMEHVGFEVDTTTEGVASLVRIAGAIAPSLADVPALDRWSGLRPVTPDFLPIIGPDPDAPSLLYATGHSRNGILLAPLTGECVARLACGEPLEHDLSPFSITRFEAAG